MDFTKFFAMFEKNVFGIIEKTLLIVLLVATSVNRSNNWQYYKNSRSEFSRYSFTFYFSRSHWND